MTAAYDLVVVGAGLAGLTAGLYGARYGLKTVIVEQLAPGGQVLNVEKIETFPGFPQGISGFDLGPLAQEQAEAAGAEFMLASAQALEVDGDELVLRCDADELRTRTLIAAMGSSLRSLGIPGETDYLGQGVSHCASCDAPFFVGKDVCVVGGGDSAVDEATVLADTVGQVLVVHRGASFSAQRSSLARLESKSNVQVLFETEVVEIRGAETVSSIVLRQAGATRVQAVSAVFIFVGLEPNTSMLRGVVDLDPAGHVVTDLWLRSSVPGVFAAGDIRQHAAGQLITAAGDGATAAVAAYRYLNGLR
jgi:thioredoxin reductase (NADPH)